MERLILVAKFFSRLHLRLRSHLRSCLVVASLSLAAMSLHSCLSLKSDYPKTSYYRLSSKPPEPVTTGAAVGTTSIANDSATKDSVTKDFAAKEILMIKMFSTDGEFDTDHLLALNASGSAASGANSGASNSTSGSTEMQKYQYHRWIREPSELVTAHAANRLQTAPIFAGGVFTEATSVLPSLELEGRIVEFMGRNGAGASGTTGANAATVTLHITLKRVGGQATDGQATDGQAGERGAILLQRVYSHTAPRPNDTAGSIPEALTAALNACLDAALKDMASALNAPR
jgi:hypothetical protein